MEHRYLDEFSDRDSVIHRLEPRTKLLCAFALILSAVLSPVESAWPFIAYLSILAVLLALSRLPLFPLLARAAAIGPFILTAVILLPFTRGGNGDVAITIPIGGAGLPMYREGLKAAEGILLKSIISAFSVLILVSTTPVARLLKALQRLRFPPVMITIIGLMYRYLFLLQGEFLRLTRAARSRNWEACRWRLRIRVIGWIIGSLFLRTYERGERVYLAMRARGYDGTTRTLRDTVMSPSDYAVLAGFSSLVTGLFVLARCLG